ncbi:hypothetical protein [Canibacter zhoujuaniae]|uniref:hypothetical protein n=1 Tax=Canibacter zhoujuaniae TaxID=2708343 RepID=UPI00141F5BA3|nr:hypothetical protein [Canibacter zhoujuaniae]
MRDKKQESASGALGGGWQISGGAASDKDITESASALAPTVRVKERRSIAPTTLIFSLVYLVMFAGWVTWGVSRIAWGLTLQQFTGNTALVWGQLVYFGAALGVLAWFALSLLLLKNSAMTRIIALLLGALLLMPWPFFYLLWGANGG